MPYAAYSYAKAHGLYGTNQQKTEGIARLSQNVPEYFRRRDELERLEEELANAPGEAKTMVDLRRSEMLSGMASE